ncbi:MAG TPA: glycosyltransferase [Solirubrobacteraceae bacterium]|nr:glycosyltransferase [Solirubrobacteraceae bacterium]
MTEPLVSVVVATRDRPRSLGRLLRSLAGQTLGPDRFEVIVVDDGSSPETAAVLAADVRTAAVRHPRALGPAAARNTGWRRAGAPLVAFTDDDCTPHPGWLEALLAASTAHPGAVVQGITRPDPAELDRRGLLSHTVSIEGLGPQYQTCNIAYPRSLLADLGGFDERFGPGSAGEDTDLAWRAIESGRSTVLASEAVVDHAVESTGVIGSLRLAVRWGTAVRVLGEHPAARVMLHRGLFWNVWHYLMWRSLLALLAPAWLQRIVVTRHLAQLRRRAAERGAGSAAVPFLLVRDALECAAVAGGAVRHRVWVL